MTVDVLDRLRRGGWLSDQVASRSLGQLASEALAPGGALRGSQLGSVGEFGRTVHAEMSAITDAARRGVPTQGATLFTTTFPCHNCARHIVAAGVKRVVFIEPYPKSRALDLHKDSIAVDSGCADAKVRFEPFVGISPRLYQALFTMSPRKDDEGRALHWQPHAAFPRRASASPLYINDEQAEIVRILNEAKRADLL